MIVLKLVGLGLCRLALAVALAASSAAAAAAEAAPELATSTQPFALTFPPETSAFEVYRVWGSRAGIEVRRDAELREQKVAVDLAVAPARQSLQALQRLYSHLHFPLDAKTLLVVDDTPQKRREYESFAVRILELRHAPVSEVATLLRSTLTVRHLVVNQPQQRLVVFDSTRRLDLIERLVRLSDVPSPEVTIDVELLRIEPATVAPFSGDHPQGRLPTRLAAADFARLKATGAEILVHWSVSGSHRETQKMAAIDRVPITITPLTAAASSIPGDLTDIASLHQEIGLRVAVTPRIHGRDSVTLDVRLAASNASGQVKVDERSLPAFASREIETSARLSQGETFLVSGFLREAGPGETPTDLPQLGPLFAPAGPLGDQLVLAFTPRVDSPGLPSAELSQTLLVGRTSELATVSDRPIGSHDPATTSRDRVRERLRERLRSMPRSTDEPKAPEG
ncbi:MAG: hypothetical protein AAF657_00650 [Acidobacteriota bacterium]